MNFIFKCYFEMTENKDSSSEDTELCLRDEETNKDYYEAWNDYTGYKLVI